MGPRTSVREVWAYVGAFLSDMVAANERPLGAAVDVLAEVLRTGGLIYTAGSGHSLGSVNETFYRAGGLVPVRPVWAPELFPLNGALRSSETERTEGIGRRLIDRSGMGVGDALLVFSNSGVNPVPVEEAATALERGARVVSVMSTVAQKAAPRRAGQLLQDVSTIVIDTGVPPGDAYWPRDEPRTAPISTLANVAVWDTILAGVLESAPDVPVWSSGNVSGTEGSNGRLAREYSDRIPELFTGSSV